MKSIVIVFTLLPSLAWGGALDAITSDLVAAASGIRKDQIVDGEKALLALKGRELLSDTKRYKPLLLVPIDGPELVAPAQCSEQKAFSVNADEPEISGTHTEFDVLHITFALCTKGPLSPAQVKTTAEVSQSRLKLFTAGAPPSPYLDALAQVKTSKIENSVEMLQFTVAAFGHGAAFLPTAVTLGPDNASLAVQFYIADYIRLPKDPKLDTQVTAPLRKAVESPVSFAEALLRSAYIALESVKAQPGAPADGARPAGSPRR